MTNKLYSFSLLIIALITFSLQNIVWVTPTEKTIKVALIQANIAQELKWEPEQTDINNNSLNSS